MFVNELRECDSKVCRTASHDAYSDRTIRNRITQEVTTMRLRLRQGVIDALATDHNFRSDFQTAAALRVSVDDVEAMRHGAEISPEMALLVASIQGSGFDLSAFVEPIPARPAVSA